MAHQLFAWATGFAVVATLMCAWLPGRAHVRAAAAAAADTRAEEPERVGS